MLHYLHFSRCSPQTFPIFLTTPVGSVSCERSFSALRRLKLWTHSSMIEERLSGLAMLLIHRGTNFIPVPEEKKSQLEAVETEKTPYSQFQ